MMVKHTNRFRFVVPALVAVGVAAFASEAAADTSCVDDRCSTAAARLKLEGKDALHTTIDTGWMPSCSDGQEHCNLGLQVRAGIALTAGTNGSLFTADMPTSAVVQASWEDPQYLMLSTETIGKDSTLTITHSLAPQAELYLDIGPLEQGWVFPATRLVQMIPGSHFDYAATAAAAFEGWGFAGGTVVVPAPSLQNTQLFSVNLNTFPDVIAEAVEGTLAIHARTSPTFTYKTTKVTVGGKQLVAGAMAQLPFPEGDLNFIELPATIEGTLEAKGDIEVIPSATLSRLGDMNFSPAPTITFSSVKKVVHYDSPPQKYVFPDKTIRIPLPNVRRPSEGTSGVEVVIGTEGVIPALIPNIGEAQGVVRLSSSDPRFQVSTKPISLAPGAKTPLNITFRPEALGRAEATITVKSNDPDSPEFTFQISAEGVKELSGPGGRANGPAAAADADQSGEGCGCKTAGTSTPGYAGLFAMALGLAAFIRRRR